MSIRKWRVLKHNDAAAKNLAEKMKIPFPLAVLLQTRGSTPRKRRIFFPNLLLFPIRFRSRA